MHHKNVPFCIKFVVILRDYISWNCNTLYKIHSNFNRLCILKRHHENAPFCIKFIAISRDYVSWKCTILYIIHSNFNRLFFFRKMHHQKKSQLKLLMGGNFAGTNEISLLMPNLEIKRFKINNQFKNLFICMYIYMHS